MAINVEKILMESLLKKVEKQKLSSITVQSLLEDTGCSRQTFYNHFKDRNDLICRIYDTFIIQDFGDENPTDFDFGSSLLNSLTNMKKYRRFLEQALRMDEPGCLREHKLAHCVEFDMKWHQACYGSKKMPEELRFATEYHALASSNMTDSWILSGMPASCEEMADMITKMRGFGMEKLFAGCDGAGNPYR